MKNLFRAAAYIFLVLVFASSLVLFIFQNRLVDLLTASSLPLNVDVNNCQVNRSDNPDFSDANISPGALFQDPKFIRMQKTVVENPGSLPQPTVNQSTSTPEITPSTPQLPEYTVGNPNPFQPF
jgi:hypothetical protein